MQISSIVLVIFTVIGVLGLLYGGLQLLCKILIKKLDKRAETLYKMTKQYEGHIFAIIIPSEEEGIALDLSKAEKGIIVINTFVPIEELKEDIDNTYNAAIDFKAFDDFEDELEIEECIQKLKQDMWNKIIEPMYLGKGAIYMNEEGTLWDYQVY